MPYTSTRDETVTWYRRTRAVGRTLLATLAAGLLTTACDTSDMLDVQAPNSVPVDIYADPAFATLMVNSVIGDFECAFGSFVVAEGLLTDEFHDASLNNGNWNMDRRDNSFTSGFYGTNSCTTVTGVYTPLSTARARCGVRPRLRP